MACNCCPPKTGLEESGCIHSYKDHLKKLQGGDQRMSSLKDEKVMLVYPTGNELTAFLDIGAEAERRNDIIVNEMKCDLEKYIKENECLQRENCAKTEKLKELQKKVLENENIISSLTAEIDEIHNDACRINELKNRIDHLEHERECLLQENESLNHEISKLCWQIEEMKKIHKQCLSKEELMCKDREICNLTQKLSKAAKKIQYDQEVIEALTAENTCLENEITNITAQWESQHKQFVDKTASYKNQISHMKSKLQCLEGSMQNVNCDQLKTEQKCSDNLYSDPCDDSTNSNSQPIFEKERLLQELILKIDERNRNIQQLTKVKNNRSNISHKEYEELKALVQRQAYEINQLSNELRCRSLEDSESVDLLNEISQLQYAVYDSRGESKSEAVCSLLQKIKKVRCRIKSRLQREEARRKEIAQQLGLYRCQFINIQKEIEELRKNNFNNPGCKEEIMARMEKERTLSEYINQANCHKKELQAKCASLMKALTNIEKVNEFVLHLTQT